MTTTLLVWDEGHHQRELSDPTVADVASRIAALDGVILTVVTLYRGGSHLAVGGSANGGLVVYCTFDNESFWQLLSDGDSRTAITVVAGGQAGSYPADHVTRLEHAVAAATAFLQLGTRAESLPWESQ